MLKAPFPWFGGKSRAAPLIWSIIDPSTVHHYIEPFAGSMPTLLYLDTPIAYESVNDADGFICNFWCAIKNNPAETALYADWPVIESDLHARHAYLAERRKELTARLEGDPDFYDCKLAGWWVAGVASWIAGRYAVPGSGPWVRVLCGDWKRIVGRGYLNHLGQTFVFLDPPYSLDERSTKIYSVETPGLSDEVREWCIAHQTDPKVRIALCGYDTEHLLDGWTKETWLPLGGYSNIGKGKTRGHINRGRETIWFSPNCKP